MSSASTAFSSSKDESCARDAHKRGAALLLADAAGLGLAYILVNALSAPVDGMHQSAAWSFLLTLSIWIVIGVSVGLYDGDRSTAVVASVATITGGCHSGSILLLGEKPSPLDGIAFCGLAMVLVLATRSATCTLLRDTFRERTVVVGPGAVASAPGRQADSRATLAGRGHRLRRQRPEATAPRPHAASGARAC